MVYRNYPGGPPTYQLRRMTGGPDVFNVEAMGDYGGQKVFLTSIVEFRDGKIVRQTDYWANPLRGADMARPVGGADLATLPIRGDGPPCFRDLQRGRGSDRHRWPDVPCHVVVLRVVSARMARFSATHAPGD